MVERIPEGLPGRLGTPVEQGYLAIEAESEVRLRRAGEALTLTIKQGHGESREETEIEVDRATFDDLWPESKGRRVQKARRKIDLEGGLVAELDEYSGELEGLSVVEVEFESGEEAAGFRPPDWFGRELTGDRAWANQSLASKGRPEKYLEFRSRPGEETSTGICRVIAARASQAAAAVRRAGLADDSEKHVHEARKSLKKARSALRLLRGAIADQERRGANAALRDAAGRLSGARDAEVKLATLGLVISECTEPERAAGWRSQLEIEAGLHRGDLRPETLAEVALAIETVARGFRGREPEAPDDLIAGNVGRGYRRGRKAMKLADRSDDPEQFHAWRKRAKDLRYQLEILEPRLPAKFTTIRERAEDLADKLGDLHDLDVLAEDLEARGHDPGDQRYLGGLIADARNRLERTCFDAGRETYEAKPGRFVRGVAESIGGPASPDR